MLRLFIEHRINVIRRRTQYQLRQAQAAGARHRRALDRAGLYRRDHPRDPQLGQPAGGAHAADGDRGLGRDPQARLNDPEAKESAGLTRNQADAILSMQLQRLTGLEADKLAQEYAGLKENIAQLRSPPGRRGD